MVVMVVWLVAGGWWPMAQKKLPFNMLSIDFSRLKTALLIFMKSLSFTKLSIANYFAINIDGRHS